MIFEISDLPEQDRKYLSKAGNWELPITTRNRFVIHTEGRENLTVRLPFTDELCGIMFALRPLNDSESGGNSNGGLYGSGNTSSLINNKCSSGYGTNYINFNTGSTDRTSNDLDDTALTSLYRETPGEILENARLTIGTMVLEDRESVWWRERSWWESGRQPPDRLQYVYGRFWDTNDLYPSGGTHLEFMPPTNLILKLRCDAPNCALIVWGITRNVAEIRKPERRVILRNPYNG
jgi:hypothetical protein